MTFCPVFSENCLFATDHNRAFERILFKVSFPGGFAFGNKPRSSSQVRGVHPSPWGLRYVFILENKSFEAQTYLLQHLMLKRFYTSEIFWISISFPPSQGIKSYLWNFEDLRRCSTYAAFLLVRENVMLCGPKKLGSLQGTFRGKKSSGSVSLWLWKDIEVGHFF